MPLFDTHSHCYWDTLEPKIPEIIEDMKKHSIQYSTQIGCDLETSKKSINLARKYPDTFFASIGFHPTDCQDVDFDSSQNIRDEYETLFLENREYIVAIGETGLDFYHMSKDTNESHRQYENQKKWWLWQVDFAKQHNLPLVIHTRNARYETIDFLVKNKVSNYILHCFSEDLEMVQTLARYDDNFMVSFSGTVTFKNAPKIQETAASISLSKILIETDSPFLAPQAVRGTVNNPVNVRYVLEKICELRSEKSKLIENTIFENSLRVYGREGNSH